jgi:hypothetical protein
MGAVRWVANRVAAAITGAAMVGAIIGLGAFIETALTCAPQCPEIRTPVAQGAIYVAGWAAMGVVFGAIPCLIVLLGTRAKRRPWRSLIALVPAAAIGFFAVLAILNAFHEENRLDFLWVLALFIIVPTGAGFIAGQAVSQEKTAQPWMR